MNQGDARCFVCKVQDPIECGISTATNNNTLADKSFWIFDVIEDLFTHQSIHAL